MESNGERHKIHVSQSTADVLTASGKAHWLTPCDEMILAKGKGYLQTYFCEPKAGAASSRGTADSSQSGGVESVTKNSCDDDRIVNVEESLVTAALALDESNVNAAHDMEAPPSSPPDAALIDLTSNNNALRDSRSIEI